MLKLNARPLTAELFAPYGQVIERKDAERIEINRGNCLRLHALAQADVSAENGAAIISIFCGQPYALPHTVDLVERHPLGSQAFYPLGSQPWLVIVCADDNGKPTSPVAFLASADQGVNIKRNVWHGVLTPLNEPSDFLVVDRAGEGNNLEEFNLPEDQIFQVTI